MGQVPAAERTVAVLRHLAMHARPVAAAAIARDLGIPRSSTYHLLTALEEARFVTRIPDEGTWALGVGVFELGQAFLQQRPLERLARPLLHRLAHDTGVAAHLAILDGRDVVYLVTERPPATTPLVVEVGVRLPAHLTASGRALLAEHPRAQVHASFPDRDALARRTQVGPRTPKELHALLSDVRRIGHGHEDGEIDPRLASVAVAVHDHTGRATAAVTLTFVGTEHDAAGRQMLAERARSCAEQLTERLGGRVGEG